MTVGRPNSCRRLAVADGLPDPEPEPSNDYRSNPLRHCRTRPCASAVGLLHPRRVRGLRISRRSRAARGFQMLGNRVPPRGWGPAGGPPEGVRGSRCGSAVYRSARAWVAAWSTARESRTATTVEGAGGRRLGRGGYRQRRTRRRACGERRPLRGGGRSGGGCCRAGRQGGPGGHRRHVGVRGRSGARALARERAAKQSNQAVSALGSSHLGPTDAIGCYGGRRATNHELARQPVVLGLVGQTASAGEHPSDRPSGHL